MAKAVNIKTLLAPLFDAHKMGGPQYQPIKLTPPLIRTLGLETLKEVLLLHGILIEDCFTTRNNEGKVRFAEPGIWYDETDGYYLLFGFNRANGDYKLPLDDACMLTRLPDTGRFIFKIAGVMIPVSTGLSYAEEEDIDDVISVHSLPKRVISGSGNFAKSLAKLVIAESGVDSLDEIYMVTLTAETEPVLGDGKYPKFTLTGSVMIDSSGGDSAYLIDSQKIEVTKTVALAIMQEWEGDGPVTIRLTPAVTKDNQAYLKVVR